MTNRKGNREFGKLDRRAIQTFENKLQEVKSEQRLLRAKKRESVKDMTPLLALKLYYFHRYKEN
jgi:hypothetical protein